MVNKKNSGAGAKIKKKPAGAGGNPTNPNNKPGGKRKRKDNNKSNTTNSMDVTDFEEELQVHEGNNYQEQQHTSKKKKKANRLTQKKKKQLEISGNSDKPIIQIRQKTTHERTLYFLEQLFIKHNIAKKFPNFYFEKVAHGFDVLYRPNAYNSKEDNNNTEGNNNEGEMNYTTCNVIGFIKYLNNLLPIRDLQNKSMIHHGAGGGSGSVLNSTNNNENETYYIEIAPICKGDLVCLPQRYYTSLGQMGPLVICYKVTNSLHFIDPFTLKTGEITSQNYFQNPFKSLFTSSQLIEYTINDIEMKRNAKGRIICSQAGRFQSGELTIVKTSELGVSPEVHTFSHLAHLFEVGDTVYGYDLKNANLNNDDLNSYKKLIIPDVIVVRKKYEWEIQRIWKLQHFCITDLDNKDYEDFLNELEEDQDVRSKVLLFKHENSNSIAKRIKFDEKGPRVRLEELLEEWKI
ncbi:hypothetical protein ABK040_009537 [Willaertia magna]